MPRFYISDKETSKNLQSCLNGNAFKTITQVDDYKYIEFSNKHIDIYVSKDNELIIYQNPESLIGVHSHCTNEKITNITDGECNSGNKKSVNVFIKCKKCEKIIISTTLMDKECPYCSEINKFNEIKESDILTFKCNNCLNIKLKKAVENLKNDVRKIKEGLSGSGRQA